MRAQVLSSSKKGIVSCNWCDCGCWVLVNSGDGEGLVDAGNELSVSEEFLWVVGAVLVGQGLKFIISKVVVELRKNRFELKAGDSSLSEFVEITEELFNTDSLLNN